MPALVALRSSTLTRSSQVVAWPKTIKTAMQTSKAAIQDDNVRFREEMVVEQEKFLVCLAQYKAEVGVIVDGDDGRALLTMAQT